MQSIYNFTDIYLYRDPIDFRKSINGLAAIVCQSMANNLSRTDCLFVFSDRYRHRIKILYWDKTGLALWYKRLERNKFYWPKNAEQEVVTLDAQSLEWLLEGIDLRAIRRHPVLPGYEYVF